VMGDDDLDLLHVGHYGGDDHRRHRVYHPRLAPGQGITHRRGGVRIGDGPAPHEVKIVAPAGSVILFNSADLWHSGTLNYSPAPRLAVTAGFGPGSPSC
jgi:ectoine hydroxylase-related dioxygenase (phytanoyl-CoA dioxygenase family)